MKKKILVVDDEVSLTKMVKLNLERTGKFEVRTENSGRKAEETAMGFKPDLIFLDIMMPDLSGDEIAQRFRENDQLAAIPLIFLTAIVSKDETDAMGSNIGGNKFLAKPVKTEELLEAIAEAIA